MSKKCILCGIKMASSELYCPKCNSQRLQVPIVTTKCLACKREMTWSLADNAWVCACQSK